MKLQRTAKFNIQNWQKLTSQKSVNMKFLCELLPHFSNAKEEQMLFLTPTLKKKIGKKLGWKEETCLNRCSVELNKLRSLEVVTRVDQQVYQLNPNFIGLGEDSDINKLKDSFEVKEARKKKTAVKAPESEQNSDIQKKPAKKKSRNRHKKHHNNHHFERTVPEQDSVEMSDVMKAIMDAGKGLITESEKKKQEEKFYE